MSGRDSVLWIHHDLLEVSFRRCPLVLTGACRAFVLSQSKLKAKSSELDVSLKTIKELETKVDKLEKALAESKGAEAKLRAQVGLVKGLGC